MNKSGRVLVLGARGLVGSSLVRKLKSSGYTHILEPFRDELDLMNQLEVREYFKEHKPEYIFLAAAKVGGIQANNTYRADFLLDNLVIQNNIFQAALEFKVKKFQFLGSSCIYPKHCPQPMKEEYLLTGPLEPTNEPYAIAKIAGLKLAENMKRQYGLDCHAVMPTNLYGENDNFHLDNSHVIPGMIHRLTLAMEKGESTFEVWGTGAPKREFLYVDDLADACLFLMESREDLPYWINVGSGEEVSISELACAVSKACKFEGEVIFNTDYPDGTPRKLLDSSQIFKMGWKPKVSLSEGLEKAVHFFLNSESVRK